ncbi:MAG: hypothetical protein Q9222_004082 [Ikaeria aurantiellina]
MPYLLDSQEWLHQSSLLLSAYPSTCRITTKYRISPPPPPRKRKTTLTIDSAATDSETTTTTSPPPPSRPAANPPPQQHTPLQSRAHIELKTYDPASGVCLKYKTDKAAEVGRLVAALGRCGRLMAGLPARDEAVPVEEVDGKAEEAEARAPILTAGKEGEKGGAAQVQEQGKSGGSGKKKKGKR